MRKRSEPPESAGELREKIIGLGERSGRKSFYPELRERLTALQHFRSLLDQTNDAILVTDVIGGRVRDLNQATCRMLGYTREGLTGHPVREISAAIARQISEQRPGRVDSTLRTRSGCQVPVEATVAFMGTGAAKQAVVVARDVSERRRVQDALEFLSQASVRLASSLEIKATIQNLSELAVPFLADICAVWLPSSDGKGELRGLVCHDPEKRSPAEALLEGRLLARLVEEAPSPVRGRIPRLFPEASSALQAVAGGDPDRFGAMRRLDFRSLMMIPLSSGERPLGTLMLATAESGRRYSQFDLGLATEFGRRAVLAIENANLFLEAREANRVKEEFLAVVSHELRTPLTSILGWVSLLQSRTIDPAMTARGVAVVERNARALAQIIDGLLDVSRITAGKLQIRRSPIELEPVIEAAVEALRPSAHAKNVTVEVTCARGIPAIWGDARRLQEVVWNLVSNAVKFTPAGGKVVIRLTQIGSSAEITVSDTGRGISQEFLPHVFERFRQADGSTTRGHGGLGLGLAVVQHLVEAHGGTVRARSEGEGRGACFTVTLPFTAGELIPRPLPLESEVPSLEDVRVLLVEDDADALELVSEILQRQGAQVAVASSARGALAELRRGLPDVMVSDIAMPEQDGIALLKAVREHGWAVPAVALTALAQEEDRVQAMAAGFQSYLVKPVGISELLRAVASLAGVAQPAGKRRRTGD